MKFTVDSYRVKRAASSALIACVFPLLSVGVTATAAHAQGTPEVIVTYDKSNGNNTGNVQEQHAPVDPGTGAGQTEIGADYDANGDSVGTGDGMILTPIVDPEFSLGLILTNQTSELFTTFRFSLPAGIAGAFFDPNASSIFGPSFSPSFSLVNYEDRDTSGQTRFKTIVFSRPTSQIGGYTLGDQMNFTLNMFLPAPTDPGQGFYLDLRPNEAPRGNFPPVAPRPGIGAAPEPGSLTLMIAAGGFLALYKITARRRRRRAVLGG